MIKKKDVSKVVKDRRTHYHLPKAHFRVLLGIVIALFVTSFVSTTIIVVSRNESIDSNSYLGRLKKAKEKYEYFTEKLTTLELLNYWTNNYVDVEYKKNGNIKFKEADCVSAVYHCLEHYGYLRSILNVNSMVRELKRTKSKRISNKKELRPGNLLFLNEHVALVAGLTPSGLIIYIDVNGKNMGFGINTIKFDSKRIEGIYKMSFEMWAGDLINQV